MELLVLENTVGLKLPDDIDIIDTSNMKPCTGCAGCWIVSPGQCVTKDKAQNYAKNLIKYDTITIISRLSYGGFSYKIKRFLDRCVGYLGTYMHIVDNDVRHTKRYEHTFKLNVIFYGQASEDEKETARSLVDAVCKNYYVSNSNVEFVASFKNAYTLVTGKRVDEDLLASTDITIPKHQLEEKPKNSIAIINASPKGKRAASEFYSNKLIEICEKISCQEFNIDKFYWSSARPINSDEIMKFTMYDSIILCFGLYVDGMPSHIIENLQRIDYYLYEYMRNHTLGEIGKNIKNTRLYVVSNSGLLHGNQSKHAIESLEYFSNKVGFKWGQGIGIGAGPLYTNPHMDMFAIDEARHVYAALVEFCNNILSPDDNKQIKNLYTMGHMDVDDYMNLLNSIWEKGLKKHQKI